MNLQHNRTRRRAVAHAGVKQLLAAGAMVLGTAHGAEPATIDFESVANIVTPATGTLAGGGTLSVVPRAASASSCCAPARR